MSRISNAICLPSFPNFLKDSNLKSYKYGGTGTYKTQEFIEGHLLETKDLPVSPGNALFRLEDVKKALKINLENPKKYDHVIIKVSVKKEYAK